MADNPEPPKLDPQIGDAAAYYQAFMEEIKTRLNAIKTVVDSIHAEPTRPDGFLHVEFAFLQFRLCCELLTLAILAAHQPYGLSDDLMTSWNAELALLELSKINPEAFPRYTVLTEKDGKPHFDISPRGHLTKRGMVRHYKKTARVLHRGHLRHALQNKTYDLNALERWAKRLGALLSHHILMNLSEGLVLVTHMTAGPNGAVRVAIAQASGLAALVEHEHK